jgi:hypothetical protein
MSQANIKLATPTPKDLRRAGITIVVAAFVTWLFGLHFYLIDGAEPDQNRNFALLFFIIGLVDLFVGTVVILYADKGGSPWANPRQASEKGSESAKG